MKFSTVLVFVPFALAAPSAIQPQAIEVRAEIAPQVVETRGDIEQRCNACQNVVTGIIGAIDNLGSAVEDNIQNIQSLLAQAANAADPAALANIVEALRNNIEPLIRDLANGGKSIVSNVINGVQNLGDVVKNLADGQILGLASAVRKAQALAQKIKDLIDQLNDLPGGVSDPIEGDIENLQKGLENLLAPLLAFINAVCENANADSGSTGILGGALDGVLNVVKGLLGGLGLDGLLGGLGAADPTSNLGDLGTLGSTLTNLLGSSTSLLQNLPSTP